MHAVCRFTGSFLRRRSRGGCLARLLLLLLLGKLVLALRDLLHQRLAGLPILLAVDGVAGIGLVKAEERDGEPDGLPCWIDRQDHEATGTLQVVDEISPRLHFRRAAGGMAQR